MGEMKWTALTWEQIFHMSVMYLLCIMFFRITLLKGFENLILLCFQYYVLSQNKREDLYQILYFLCGCSIFLGVIGRRIFLTVTNMDNEINDNAKFKNIFNNIDESIIILQPENMEIDYVNNQFLTTFKMQISEIYEKLFFDGEANMSKLKKFVVWLRKFYKRTSS